MAVLALDLASQTGWALYAKGMERPFSGSLRIKRQSGDEAEAIERLYRFLCDQHAMHGLTHVVFEAQHIDEKVNPQLVYLLIGMGMFTEWFGRSIGACYFKVDIGTWRKHFLGRGSFQAKTTPGGKTISGRDQAKQRAMDVCNQFGWAPADDNAADALGILDYYLSILPAAWALPRPWRDRDFMAGYRA